MFSSNFYISAGLFFFFFIFFFFFFFFFSYTFLFYFFRRFLCFQPDPLQRSLFSFRKHSYFSTFSLLHSSHFFTPPETFDLSGVSLFEKFYFRQISKLDHDSQIAVISQFFYRFLLHDFHAFLSSRFSLGFIFHPRVVVTRTFTLFCLVCFWS